MMMEFVMHVNLLIKKIMKLIGMIERENLMNYAINSEKKMVNMIVLFLALVVKTVFLRLIYLNISIK